MPTWPYPVHYNATQPRSGTCDLASRQDTERLSSLSLPLTATKKRRSVCHPEKGAQSALDSARRRVRMIRQPISVQQAGAQNHLRSSRDRAPRKFHQAHRSIPFDRRGCVGVRCFAVGPYESRVHTAPPSVAIPVVAAAAIDQEPLDLLEEDAAAAASAAAPSSVSAAQSQYSPA